MHWYDMTPSAMEVPDFTGSEYCDSTEIEVECEIEENEPTTAENEDTVHADIDIEGITAECGVEFACEDQCEYE
ncbi:hypothetical protein PsorP6_008832 [Peronosclerospora sorghi]|uniref:Uncharacterized protein n=1 Tax=Peronosclerospora sorghi TaxID=230839 RepID=A0ACC0VX72_9STRA|nr:hypothetical protein PsorP6_008832 [Peronosclerospora sorghi]